VDPAGARGRGRGAAATRGRRAAAERGRRWHDGGRDRRAVVGHDAPASPARGVAGAGALLALLVAITFGDVLFAGRTLSPSFWVPGVLPSGPGGAPTDVPLRALRDPEGGAWVDEPAPYLLHRPLASGRLPLWN